MSNNLSDQVKELLAENRRLKSKQTILGSTVPTGTSVIDGTVQFTADTSLFGQVHIEGDIIIDLVGTNDETLDYVPLMMFSLQADTKPLTSSGQGLPDYYSGAGGFSMGWAPININNTQATLRFIISPNFEMLQNKSTVYLRVRAGGTAMMNSMTVNWQQIVT